MPQRPPRHWNAEQKRHYPLCRCLSCVKWVDERDRKKAADLARPHTEHPFVMWRTQANATRRERYCTCGKSEHDPVHVVNS